MVPVLVAQRAQRFGGDVHVPMFALSRLRAEVHARTRGPRGFTNGKNRIRSRHVRLVHHQRVERDRVFPPPQRSPSAAHIKSMAEYRGALPAEHRRSRRLLGRAGARAALVQGARRASSTGSRRSRSGSRAARSTSPYNCLDRHLARRDAQQGRDHLGGRAGRHAHAHLPASCSARSAASPTRSRRSASRKGDRVAIYMGMVPEAAIAMLACARIGAAHTVVFGGFAAEALRDRMNDAEAKASSRRTAPSGAAASCRSRRRSTRRSSECPSVQARGRAARAPATRST